MTTTGSRRKVGAYRIYMNVGYGLNEHQLRSHFSTYGKVLDVYLPKHKSGRNKGYGFASFEKEDGLLAALQRERHEVSGNTVIINRAGPRPDLSPEDSADGLAGFLATSDAAARARELVNAWPCSLVAVCNSASVTPQHLWEHFSRFGAKAIAVLPAKLQPSFVLGFESWQDVASAEASSVTGLLCKVAPYSSLYEDPMQKLPPLASVARSSSWQMGMGGAGSPTIKAGPRSMHTHSCSGSLNHSFPPGCQSLMDSYPLSATSLSSAPSSSLYPSPPVKQGSVGPPELSHLSSLGLYDQQQQQQQQQLADAQALLMAHQVAGLSLSQGSTSYGPPLQAGLAAAWDLQSQFPPYMPSARPGLLPPELWDSQAPAGPTPGLHRSSNGGSHPLAFQGAASQEPAPSWGMPGLGASSGLPDDAPRHALQGLGPWLPAGPSASLPHLQPSG